MDPPIKLFGQTIAFTSSASSQDDAVDAGGTTSTGAWDELSSSPQDVVENGEESGARTELTQSECPSSCFPELSSSGSNCAEEKNTSPPRGCNGIVAPAAGAVGVGVAEDSEDMDEEDHGLGSVEGAMSQEAGGEDSGGKGAKLARRPDKAVPCPRCHSLETKFCYYNNYNVNQPRHFCKHCQRYWTAGGTLRNVPVGAGRRKNKHAGVISPRQTSEVGLVRSDAPDIAVPLMVGKGVTLPVSMQVPMVPAALAACPSEPRMRMSALEASETGVGLPYTIRVPSLEGTYILTSSDAVPCSDPGILGGKPPRLATSGFSEVTSGTNDMDGSRGWHKDETVCSGFSATCGSTMLREIKGEPSASAEFPKEGEVMAGWSGAGGGGVGAPGAPYGFFNGPWPYGYNVGWSGGAAFCAGPVASVGNGLPPPQPASVAAWNGAAAASGLWTGVPWPMPNLAWSPTGWGPPWSMAPWATMGVGAGATVALSPSVPNNGASASMTPMPGPAGPSISSGAKHCRPCDGGGSSESAVWAPKSLRIADPEEAMRSSVWRILGVGSRGEITTTPSTFKAFQPKSESKKFQDEDQQAAQATLHANPAAMSRSMYFHESN